MAKLAAGSLLGRLDDLEAPTIEDCSRGIKLSKITAKLKGSIDIVPCLGKFQQLGLVKIFYNPSVDEESLVQITEKGKLQAMELLRSLQPPNGSAWQGLVYRVKKQYKKVSYQYEQICLDFPKQLHELLWCLCGRRIAVRVSRGGNIIHIFLIDCQDAD